MKRFLSACLSLLLCFSMTAGSLPAQAAGTSIPITEEYFPDPVFRAFLDTDSNGEHIDANRDGWLDVNERSNVYSLNMNKNPQRPGYISDLTGIGYFRNLRALFVRNHTISWVDLSQNPNLTMLDLSSNYLTELDLTANNSLVNVYCQNNRLSKLLLGCQPNLQLLYCSNNDLSTLDLEGCTDLQWVEMEQNYFRQINLPFMPNRMLVAPCFQKLEEPVSIYTHESSWCFFLAHNPTNGDDVTQDFYYDPYGVTIDPREGKIIYAEPDGMPFLEFNPGVTSIRVNLNNTKDGASYPECFYLKLLPKAPEVSYTWVEEVPASCTEDGMMGFYAGSDGLMYVMENDGTMVAVSYDYLVIPALGHDWLPTEYTWSDDYTWCTAHRVCRNEINGMHSEGQKVRTRAFVTRYPTATEPGETRYEADFDAPWAEDQVIFVSDIPFGNYEVSLDYDSSMGLAYADGASAAEGERVDFTVLPEDGYKVRRIWITSAAGELTYTKVSDVEYYFIAPGCDCCIHIEFTADSQAFEDVSPNAYYFDAVNWAVHRNVTSGISPTKFGPNQSCTRAQAVSFIWRASGCPEPTLTVNPFADVSMNSYYAKAVLWAVEEGIASGISSNMFGPNRPCTRAQIVSFLYRGSGKPPVDGGLPFVDVSEHDFYADAVKWAVALDITAGITPASFCPGQNCTRAQIVSFLMRAEKAGS